MIAAFMRYQASIMALNIEHELQVNASAATVWNVISDLDKYPEWNPFVTKCASTKKPGDPIVMRVRVLPFFAQPQTEFVKENEEGKKFSYGMKPMPLGMLSSYRYHEITAIDENSCTYKSSFTLSGPWSSFVKVLLAGNLRRGFTEMSNAIKERAENLASK
jgi:ribosome-associated toxin RatA of RatAB toxin-antitoxin module